MKLTKREKVLLCILMVFVVIYVLYTFVLSKDESEDVSLSSEYNQLLLEYNDMRKNILSKSENEKEIKKLNFEISELSNGFLNSINQEQIIVFMDDYLNRNQIYTNAISFTDVTDVPVQQTNGDGSEENQINLAKSMTLNLTYKAPYNNVLNFIDDLQNNVIDIVISNMNFTATDDGEIQGSMTISFYAIDKLKDAYYEEWVWQNLIVSGVDNPFYKTPIDSSQPNNETQSTEDNKKYDFIMTAKPTSADLPTLVFGKTNDTTRDSYVYADSNNIENINIEFKTEDNKYFYKYSTANDLYPEDGSFMEFVPYNKDGIDMVIYSVKRNSDADTSGVKINIINGTQVKVNVNVIDDDTVRPRISFESLKGIVIK